MDTHPYSTLEYARTLAHIGRPLLVPSWRTNVLVREFGLGVIDATGPYPLTVFGRDADIASGLDSLREAGLVSTVLVVSSLADFDMETLQQSFSVVRPFKKHYVVDGASGAYTPTDHHAREITRAYRRGIEIREVSLGEILNEWMELYSGLVVRHNIEGIQQFSLDSFSALSMCEGLVTIAAYLDGDLVSCHLWIEDETTVTSHLAASNANGYRNGAAYAVYDHSIRLFGKRIVNLGGSAGVGNKQSDGLAIFKAGFANGSASAYLCGCVHDSTNYAKLCEERGDLAAPYFPAYRG